MIYIESKRADLSQTIFTIFTEIDELDGVKDGYVSTQQFKEAIKIKIGSRSQLDVDTEFLSLKYRSRAAGTAEEFDRVYYKFFYKDYEDLENDGLGDKIDGL